MTRLSPMKFSSRAARVRGSLHNQKLGAVRVGVNVTTEQLERVRSVAVANGFSIAGAIRHLIDAALADPVTPGYHSPRDQNLIG
jgi:hypothetical protein